MLETCNLLPGALRFIATSARDPAELLSPSIRPGTGLAEEGEAGSEPPPRLPTREPCEPSTLRETRPDSSTKQDGEDDEAARSHRIPVSPHEVSGEKKNIQCVRSSVCKDPQACAACLPVTAAILPSAATFTPQPEPRLAQAPQGN
ncbi:unnamed protein product [Pleuronectes platessa]|uniref:Uncharacterized protein n=1 Tax=Pleuronectes platessa TaxID=8262 RepID=A0A9N7YJD8_PLEPL|nr:unnamed protein product [Pleuronectes platessa]